MWTSNLNPAQVSSLKCSAPQLLKPKLKVLYCVFAGCIANHQVQLNTELVDYIYLLYVEVLNKVCLRVLLLCKFENHWSISLPVVQHYDFVVHSLQQMCKCSTCVEHLPALLISFGRETQRLVAGWTQQGEQFSSLRIFLFLLEVFVVVFKKVKY